MATALADAGVSAGDRVLLLTTNRPEFLETVVATNLLGAIAVPVNFRLAPTEVQFLVGDCDPTALVVEEALAPLVSDLLADETTARPCFVVGDPTAASPNATAYETAATAPDLHPGGPAQTDLNTCALIMYTSGTTGRPKGAMLSYENLLAQTVTLVQAFRLFGDDEIAAVTAPLFHIGALGAALPNLILGYTSVITPTGAFDPEVFLDLIETERVTNAFLVPTQWQMVAASPTIANRDLNLRCIAWGAAPATPAILRAMNEAFPGVMNVCTFGQTEMSPVTTILSGEHAVDKIGSIGRPVTMVDVRVVDANLDDVAQGEVGEIIYRGPQTMLGYWGLPEQTAEAFRGGWFHSGDLVRVDEDGFYYVVDRLKDMIISGGENIYCAEVESVIADHPKVLEVAIVGAPHDKWGETPIAMVVPRDANDAPTSEEIIAFAGERLASYKKPTQVMILDALPRNASGKVLKAPLREQARETVDA